MTNDGMIFEAHKKIVQALEPVITSGVRRRAQLEKVRVCAYGEVLSVNSLSRSWQLLLSGARSETARKNKKSEKCARLRVESGFR